MKFIQVINNKKFTLIGIFLCLYVVLNFFDGERGVISYFEKQKVKEELLQEKKLIVAKLTNLEKKNRLLTDVIDLDYLETLYRKKFMFGKLNEQIYINE